MTEACRFSPAAGDAGLLPSEWTNQVRRFIVIRRANEPGFLNFKNSLRAPSTFRQTPDHLVPLLQQPSHVALQEQHIRQPPEQTQWRGVVKDVRHPRSTRDLHEMVIVHETRKRPRDHRVPEVDRLVHRIDTTGEPLPHAEVRRLPSDRLPRFDQPRSPSSNRSLAMPRLTLLVNIDASREVEDPLDRRSDVGNDLDPGHATSLETIATGTSLAGNLALFTRVLHH